MSDTYEQRAGAALNVGDMLRDGALIVAVQHRGGLTTTTERAPDGTEGTHTLRSSHKRNVRPAGPLAVHEPAEVFTR